MSENSPERNRPDACPGALQVHPAADGGLARVRVPGGELTTSQVDVLARASVELGHPEVELTSRANLQVRGLREGGEQDLAQRLDAAGLLPSTTHERVRNIVASPYAGCDGEGVTDVQRIVGELDAALCATPGLAELPGRFLFTVDDGRGDLAGLDADVGVVAVGADEMAVLIGGVDHGLRVSPRTAAAAALAAAGAFLDERASRQCRAWRVVELGDTSGIAARVRAGIGAEHAVSDVTPGPAQTVAPDQHPQVGEVARWQGKVALAVGAPLGRLSPGQLHSIIQAAEAASGTVRLTPWRTVALPGFDEHEAPSWLSELGQHGLIVEPSSAWVGVTACTGQPGCAKALADVRGDAARTLTVAAGTGADALPVHWVGCERRCGRPRGRVVEVLATPSGYRIGVGDDHGNDRVRDAGAQPGELAAPIDAARSHQPFPQTEDETVNEDSR